MALFQAILGEIRGSIGNDTWSRNPSGAYIRQRTTPVNPNTPGQNDAKAALTGATGNWRFLTQAQRNEWNLYADNTFTKNKLGETIKISGLAWYTAINTFRLRAGLGTQDDGPTDFGRAINAAINFDVEEELQVGAIALSPQGSQMLQLQWAGPFSTSINFFNGPWPSANTIYATPAVLTGTVLVPTAIPGERYFLQWRNHDTPGRTSELIKFQAEIVAIPPP